MSILRSAVFIAAAVVASSSGSAAQVPALTLDEVLAIARRRAPLVASALGRTEEAQGRLSGASVFFQENPLLEGAWGRRSATGSSDEDVRKLGVSQSFGLGRTRSARIAGAEASLARAKADEEWAIREVLRRASVGFHEVAYSGERLKLAISADSVAAQVLHIAQQRHRVGDVPRLEVNLAQVARSRTRAEISAARAIREGAISDLRLLLGLPSDEPFAIREEFVERGCYDLAELLRVVSERPDLRALAAAAQEAEADVRLGSAHRWPQVSLGAEFEREGEEEISAGKAALTLPLFNHGQGLREESLARKRRLEGELEAGRIASVAEVRTAFDLYRQRVEAVEELETNALPLLDENEALARRSYEAGQLALADYLVIRGELLGTRTDYLNRLLEAALAEVELKTSAGILK